MRFDRRTRSLVLAAIVTEIALLFAAGCIVMLRPAPSSPDVRSTVVQAAVLPRHHEFSFTVPRRPPRPPRPARLNVPYESLIHEAAQRHRLSPHLVAAMTRVESSFDPLEISHKGARGLMQVMPATGARFGVEPDALFDPERNIAAGTAYLRWLLDRYQGNLDLALAGYNAGEGAVDKYGGIPPYRETQNYVRKVRMTLAEMRARGASVN